MGFGGGNWVGAFPAAFILILLWGLFWKGFALWYAAKRNDKWWFVALLLINTAGVLEIVYIFFVAKVPEFRQKLGLK
ncbi:hypothetical protein A2853_03770 [Candidatus Kaiserbacteria bacterium RIFCSPHIGHO2_01_FULL_55_17]|uniref:DUF5652 domain-containing protein n=1 Tax=Candidatus Kaiserbacteria bacterium RIFCSPHIGHO2_01_FULL_55_17 TaxID=1798484 RepID=A0A1F6D922_9BACT|nr:MAG: hypothetical protein A2853_03770 [Candidatus Kaiserbacteria bacterium RIFCSPHIGHO2_01_FULL_55_17]